MKNTLITIGAVVLGLVLVVLIALVALMLSLGGSIRGQGYTPESLGVLLVLVALCVAVGLMLKAAVAHLRRSRMPS